MKTVLYHCTPRNNLPSIQLEGLMLSMARNRKQSFLWFVIEPNFETKKHVAKRHKKKVADLVWLAVVVDDYFFIKHRLHFAYQGYAMKTKRDIAACQITLVNDEILAVSI